MTIDDKLAQEFQQPDVGRVVHLYALDITDITGNGSDIYYFVEATLSGISTVEYNGVEYFPANVQCEGFEVRGEGEAPRPKIKVANVNVGAGVSIANAAANYDDLLGGVITRKITMRDHLDDGSDPDTDAYYEETWIISRKTAQTKEYLEFELAAYMDFEGQYAPRRLILRDTCTHLYRSYDAGFDYTNATCPWADGTHGYYFDRTGAKCAVGDDKCGKRLTDCKLRYVTAAASYTASDTEPASPSDGDLWLDTSQVPNVWQQYNTAKATWIDPSYDQLPTRAFPMVAKVRVY